MLHPRACFLLREEVFCLPLMSSAPSGRAAHRSSSPALGPLAPGVAPRCAHRPAPPARSRTPPPGRTEWSRTSPPESACHPLAWSDTVPSASSSSSPCSPTSPLKSLRVISRQNVLLGLCPLYPS